MMELTKGSQKQLFGQHVGTGVLFLKTEENMVLRVEVFIRPRDGVLCRLADGKPVLPIELTYETWDEESSQPGKGAEQAPSEGSMMVSWKILGRMCTDNEEKVDGLYVIHTAQGEFVAFAEPAYRDLIQTAPQLADALTHLQRALRLNEADVKPGTFAYLNDIIDRALVGLEVA